MERRYYACLCATARTGFGIRTLRPGFATQHISHVIRSIRPNVRYWPHCAGRSRVENCPQADIACQIESRLLQLITHHSSPITHHPSLITHHSSPITHHSSLHHPSQPWSISRFPLSRVGPENRATAFSWRRRVPHRAPGLLSWPARVRRPFSCAAPFARRAIHRRASGPP